MFGIVMKQSTQWIILLCCVFAAAACAADSSSTTPLYSLAPGTKWSYDETKDLVEIVDLYTNVTHVTGTVNEEIFPAPAHYKKNGDTVLSQSTSKEQHDVDGHSIEVSGGSIQILEWRHGDLYSHGIRVWVDGSYSEAMNLYDPPLPLLKSAAHPGETWTVGNQKNMGIGLSTIATMQAPETVTVPAGTFTNCLKVLYSSTVESLNGKARLEGGNVQDTIWYAKNVGTVKEFQVSRITYVTQQGRIFDHEEQTRVLRSHTPAK